MPRDGGWSRCLTLTLSTKLFSLKLKLREDRYEGFPLPDEMTFGAVSVGDFFKRTRDREETELIRKVLAVLWINSREA
jgi:hypothetical protein